MESNAVFKKENGDKYDVKVNLYTDYSSRRYWWTVSVLFAAKGKRKWTILNCQDDYKYRALDMEEREIYYKKFILSHIPAEWIYNVQRSILTELGKPIFNV